MKDYQPLSRCMYKYNQTNNRASPGKNKHEKGQKNMHAFGAQKSESFFQEH